LKDRTEVQAPLLWLEDLAKKYSWLQILRSPQHIPEDPWELVEFIENLKAMNGKTDYLIMLK
jgi:hypothetical protein